MAVKFCLEVADNKDFTCLQSIYFPLCIILSENKLDSWYHMNYMLPFAKTDGVYNLSCDLTDAYVYGANAHIYSQIMRESDISIVFCGQILDIVSTIINNINKGRYCVIFLDFYQLSQSKSCYQKKHFIHELLFYGFDQDEEKFLCFGYADGAFRYLVLSYEEVKKAFQSVLAYIAETDGWEDYMIMTFQIVYHWQKYPYNGRYVLNKLKEYTIGKVTEECFYNSFNQQKQMGETYAFGIYVTDVFVDYLKQVEKVKEIAFFRQFPSQFTAFHMYRDFHVAICKNLQFFLKTEKGECRELDLLVRRYHDEVVNKCNAVRLSYLKLLQLSHSGERELMVRCIAFMKDRLVRIQEQEEKILTEFIDLSYRIL